jgi:hypothetical protein
MPSNPGLYNLFIWLFALCLGILGAWAIVNGLESRFHTGAAVAFAKIVIGVLLILLAVMLVAVGTIIQV